MESGREAGDRAIKNETHDAQIKRKQYVKHCAALRILQAFSPMKGIAQCEECGRGEGHGGLGDRDQRNSDSSVLPVQVCRAAVRCCIAQPNGIKRGHAWSPQTSRTESTRAQPYE